MVKSDLSKLRHARSKKDFPEITLLDDEYVVLKVSRSPIIPILIWAGVAFAGFMLIAAAILIGVGSASAFNGFTSAFLGFLLLVIFATLFIVGLVSNRVYNQNKLYVTNRRIMQICKISLVAGSTNVIDLGSIEDVSFKENGILDHLFRMGTLRMSTVGDETTYTFKYLDTPEDELDIITGLVHQAKSDQSDKK